MADYLDLSNVPNQEIYTIHSLAELPSSSEREPKIVLAKNAINENLPQEFYGIVITDYLFDITGKKCTARFIPLMIMPERSEI